MNPIKPSATAWRVALRRAVHQIIDQPTILADPVALRIVGQVAAQEFLRKEPSGGARAAFTRSLRAFVVARSRFAEDQLAAAVANGVTQYVVLGAGLDTFAYRNGHSTLRIFEVDHPATQSWKHELLQRAAIPVPANLTFVPVDFETQSLPEMLLPAAFDPNRPSFFSWLGVVPYLTLASFQKTLGFIGQLPASTAVVFDYAIPPDELPLLERMAFKMLASRVASVGEPFQLFLSEEAMRLELRNAGFAAQSHLSTQHMNRLYFQDRTDGFETQGGLPRLAHAQRQPKANKVPSYPDGNS